MSTPAFSVAASVAPRSSFTPNRALCPRPRHQLAARPARRAAVSMVSEVNIDKKREKVDVVKERLENCQMLFATSLSGLSVAQVYDLRQRVPKTTKCMTVKNTLMRRAIEESEWAPAREFTFGSSLWFFVQDDFKGSVDAFEKFAKELKRDSIVGGVYEGQKCDGEGIKAIAALPSKQELIQKIAFAIKQVPTKVARSVKAVPTKVAVAVKLAVADESKEDGSAAE